MRVLVDAVFLLFICLDRRLMFSSVPENVEDVSLRCDSIIAKKQSRLTFIVRIIST